VQPGKPLSGLLDSPRLHNGLPRRACISERMIENHRPPEPYVPGQPIDAWRSDGIALTVGPLRVPTFGILYDMEPSLSRPPQAFLLSQPLKVLVEQLPADAQLVL